MILIPILATPTLVVAAGRRGQHFIYNDSDATMYFAPDGDAAVTTGTGFPLNPGDRFIHEPPQPYAKTPVALYMVHGGVGEKNIRYGCSEPAA